MVPTTHTTMVEIIPAVMPDTYEELVSQVGLVRNAASWIQIDVMDGMFTDSVSWPYAPGSTHFEALVADEEGLPFWESVNYEVDLMINNPFVEAPRWLLTSAARIILHHKSLARGDGLALCQELKAQGAELVLALRPSEDISVIEPYIEYLDGIQCMGIERVGFQGEPFVTAVIPMIERLHTLYPDIPISVDGGVNVETAPMLAEAGATRLVSGSYIFTSEDAKASIAELKKISNV
jgi:ribulose-phosphate 3-epimerase